MTILRAIFGNLDAGGGEMLMGYHPAVISEDAIALTHLLAPEQRSKQLLLDSAKVLSYEFWEEYNEASEKVFGRKWASQILAGALAKPAPILKTIAEGKPYPVKAFLNSGSAPSTSFTDAHHTPQPFILPDLPVLHDIFMRPTHQPY